MFEVAEGMPKGIFQDKYSRRKADGSFQSWAERLTQVVEGSYSLLQDLDLDPDRCALACKGEEETLDLALRGIMPFSGRHLQHGEVGQRSKRGEYFSNCSSAPFSFLKFWLLLKGSGVGRRYDSELCRVDWRNMPNAFFVLDAPDNKGQGGHPDYQDWILSTQQAEHMFGSESETMRWFDVEDSAEGWVKIVEVLETAAFQCKHKNSTFVFNLSKVRQKGAPIGGVQGRPASGPVPLIKALQRIADLKGVDMPCWRQALFVDHYLSACVAFGGVRRSSRMGVKYWRDKDIFDFISIKRGGHLYTANLSVGVDAEFWDDLTKPGGNHAKSVFREMTASAYDDQTGEPGFINLDKLVFDRKGIERINSYSLLNEQYGLNLHRRTYEMLENFLEVAKKTKYPFVPNPCVTADTLVETTEGPRSVASLVGVPFETVVCGQTRRSESTGFFRTGHKPVFLLTTEEGHSLKLTADHKVLTPEGFVEARDLRLGQKVILNSTRDHQVPNSASKDFAQGWLVGNLLGDGFIGNTSMGAVQYWQDKGYMSELASTRAVRGFGLSLSFSAASNDSIRAMTKGLGDAVSPWVTDTAKNISETVLVQSADWRAGMLRGIFDADGSPQGTQQKGVSVRLPSINLGHLALVQKMLMSFGIASKVYKYRKNEGTSLLPDGKGGQKEYPTHAIHELIIAKDNLAVFAALIGFDDRNKCETLRALLSNYKRNLNHETFTAKVESLTYLGNEDVYDCTIADIHRFSANGIVVHNCSEVTLAVWGAYCIIGDVCLAYATRDEALSAVARMPEFLIRANTMSYLYDAEVRRTNRVGVGLTGIHEFAWRQFGLSFEDLLDEQKSEDFWQFINLLSDTALESAQAYSDLLGLENPHATLTIKPSGTISKVMSCSEGAHLPAYDYMVRWVQYPKGSAGHLDHLALGYPVKDISHQFTGQVVVGFPTVYQLAKEMGDKFKVHNDVSVADHYKWLRLLERHWLRDGQNGQVSYTLKYDPTTTTYEQYAEAIKVNQPTVRCCAMFPKADLSAYAYVPEQRISRNEYLEVLAHIKDLADSTDYDEDTLMCEGGACPIERSMNK